MDWRRCGVLIVLSLFSLTSSSAWSSNDHNSIKAIKHQQNEVSPYIDLIICPVRHEPWSCARQQSARILDLWDNEVYSQWQKLKVEADRQLNATVEKRGYSAFEVPTKEKPSSILKKIEIGTNFMKQFLAETMDGFLGREYEYMQGKQGNAALDDDNDNDNDNDDDGINNETDEDEPSDYENSVEEDSSKNSEKDTSQEHDKIENEDENESENETDAEVLPITDNASNGIEFIEIEDNEKDNQNGQLKRPEGKKKKKKGQQSGNAPATVVVVQQPVGHTGTESHGHGDGGGFGGGGHGGGKPLKQKRKKRKKHQQHGGGHGGGGESVVVVEEEPSIDHHIGLGLLEELADADDLLDVGGGKRKKKHPSKYGRSNGVTRGKKKKKKKALMKLILLGTFLKAKIELLLKILGAHLQIKFFAIALIGLLINIARFWIDVKRGGAPQKVIYVEHAHHQHHYEDHGEDWGEQGSYWKRSLQTDPTVEEDGFTDSYQLKPQQHQYQKQQQQQHQQQQQPHDAHYMAYRGQWQ